MGGKTGEWGEGPAGATVPYDVRGLHAARGANWTAPRGDIAQKLKNKTRTAAERKKKMYGPLAHWEAVARSRPQQEK